MRSKAELLAELEGLLHDVFAARAAGGAHPRLARAHGYVDGYMRVMLESGMATKEEVLAMVAYARAKVNGPATREIEADATTETVAA